MSDEIKEKFYSLEELKRTIDSYDGYLDNEEVYYFIGTLRFAYDYITNLREENERLKATMFDETLLINELADYKSRCEKAIELLNKYRNRKDTYCLWCMEYGDNAEVIKVLGGKVINNE